MPEWNMNFEEILYIIQKKQLKDSDFENIIQFYKNELPENPKSEKGFIGKYNADELIKKLKKNENTDEKYYLIAQIIYSYLKEMKSRVKEIPLKESNLYLKKTEDIRKLTNILKTKHVLEIINLSDGSLNLSQISKKIGIPISNLSKLVKELKKLDILYLTDRKTLNLSHKKIKIDLERMI